MASGTVDAVGVNSPRRAVLALCNSLVSHNNSLNVDSELTVSLSQMLYTVHRKLTPGMSVTVISDFSDLDQESATALSEITRRCKLNLQRVDDPLEQHMFVRGRVGISDGCEVRHLVVSEEVRHSYRKKREVINRRLTDLVNLSGATLLGSDAEQNILMNGAG